MRQENPRKLVIWRFLDGKPGHEKQSQGLCHALVRLRGAEVFEIPVPGGWAHLWRWMRRGLAGLGHLPDPDLLVGAGHGTHLPLLAARHARGGKAVVLMGPSLPLALFDLCLIPEHDRPPARANVVPTIGALNPLVPEGAHDPRQGLILVGGPSAHFRWDNLAVVQQIKTLTDPRPDMAWTLTTSRRTPADFLAALGPGPIQVYPAQDTPPGWLEGQLARCGEAWATPDSVSMVYEALSAGCRLGLFQLPPIPGSRVAQGLMDWVARNSVNTPPPWPSGLLPPLPPLQEADRCARIILTRWFP